jgi:hypothetical protein
VGEYKGFVGPTYQALSTYVSADRCVNWYPESIPTEGGKSKIAYYPTPGLVLHAATNVYGGPGRGAIVVNGRKFGVAGNQFFEFDAAGDLTPWGNVATDGLSVSMAASNTQIAIASAGKGYVFNLSTNAFTALATDPDAFQGASQFTYLDGYFIALTPGTQQIQISALGDAITWSALDIGINAGIPDNLTGIIADHEFLYLFGGRRTMPWQNTGNADFPLSPIPGTFIDEGLVAPASLARAADTLLWLGQDDRGAAVAYRAAGFRPDRFSTHAVERAWQQYKTVKDAIAFTDQRNGHLEYRITFPSGDATWVFDFATNMWHERASFVNGLLHAQLQQFHCYDGGVHYVLASDGNLYRETQGIYTDAGNPILRMRRAPVLSGGGANPMLFFQRFAVDFEPGEGLDGTPAPGTSPTLMMRYSNDGGKNWSNQATRPAGAIGETDLRGVWNAVDLGAGRRRVFEVTATDPINWVMTGADLDVVKGTS